MENIRVEKKQLIEDLSRNRAKHRAIFDEAVVGYRKQAVEQLEAQIARIQKGSLLRVYVSLPAPEDYTRDYDRAIEMLKRSIEETAVLSEQDFQAYVQDDWSWKRQFLLSNSTYSKSAEDYLATYTEVTPS
jgi:hypothetical protein